MIETPEDVQTIPSTALVFPDLNDLLSAVVTTLAADAVRQARREAVGAALELLGA